MTSPPQRLGAATILGALLMELKGSSPGQARPWSH